MPAGDRTGPWGAGPRTGRGLGYCSGYGLPGYMSPAPGRGFGRGYGRGLGLGRGYGRGLGLGRGRRFRFPMDWGSWGYPYPPAAPFGYPAAAGANPPVDEESVLAEEAAYLESELARIKDRLGELKKGKEAKKNAK